MRHRFKGLDLIDRGPDELWTGDTVTLYRRQGSRPSPCKRNAKKAKWLSGEALQIAVKRREAEDIMKRWQQYTEELYKKDLHDQDNHDGVITHLEPDILECEVKWALGSITTNNASGGDGIPVELFQILKDDAVKVLYSICQQIWKTQ